MVWSVQDECPDPRRDRCGAGRSPDDCQAERRREPRDRHALQRHEHPDAVDLRRRRGSQASGRGQRQRPAVAGAQRISAYFPLTPGQRGEAIRDLQRRLGAAGFPPAVGAEAAFFCPATEAAVRAFQSGRGLRCDGICDEQTWTALVEASWNLGDRLLFLTSPNLRGDDVAELQSRLGRIGFDCGRVDGILGPSTARALEEFQSNCGTPADGVCGPDTVRTLTILSSQTGAGPGIAAVRERERLRAGLGSVAQCRIVIGQYGGLSALSRTLSRELRLRGATVMSLDEPDAVAQATAANHFAADVYLGFEINTEPAATVQFYRVPAFESAGGRSLAEIVAEKLHCVCGLEAEVQGMRLTVLRETRMPAVQCIIGPVRIAIDAGPAIVSGVIEALEQWVSRSS